MEKKGQSLSLHDLNRLESFINKEGIFMPSKKEVKKPKQKKLPEKRASLKHQHGHTSSGGSAGGGSK
jgi:hypothetical protein